jgi:hypothetical protein
MSSGGSPSSPKQTPEEKALLRTQLLTLSRQDEEIQQRKRRIITGQYGSFATKLKSGASSSGNAATGGRVTIPTRPTGPSTQ